MRLVRFARTRPRRGCRVRSCVTWSWISQGRLWLGTRNGVAVREGERFRAIPLPNVPDPRVYGLAREPNGGMLIGTRRGLVWYRDGRTQLYGEKEGLPGEAVYCLLPDGKGGVWIGTERGLARWEKGRITPIGPDDITKRGVISMARDRERPTLAGSHGRRHCDTRWRLHSA